MLVFVVLVVAAGCLAGGLLAGQVALIWGALGLSLAGAALLAFVLVRGRRQGSAGVGGIPADLLATSAEQPAVKGAVTSPAGDGNSAEEVGQPPAEDVAVPAVPAVDGVAPGGDGEQIVWVMSGRRRFHAEDCRLLTGRASEEISLGEAREEGFSACTACIPRVEGLASRVPAGTPAP